MNILKINYEYFSYIKFLFTSVYSSTKYFIISNLFTHFGIIPFSCASIYLFKVQFLYLLHKSTHLLNLSLFLNLILTFNLSHNSI